jgi:hypothetical protein
MSAGANQQLIAEKLDEPEAAPLVHTEEFSVGESQSAQQRPDGELEIDHSEDQIDKIHIDDHGNLNLAENVDEVDDNQNFDHYESQDINQQYQNQESNLSAGDSVGENYNDEEILPPLPPQPEIPEILHRPSKILDDSENRDPGKDLFDDLATQDSNDSEEKPTLDQPESSDTPMMEHQRIVIPPSHPGDLPKSDRPFDPQEAMQAMGVMQQTLPSAPSAPESPAPAPVIEVPETQPSGDSLADLEKSVGSSHVALEPVVNEEPSQLPPPDLDGARDTVIQAANSVPPMFPEPFQSIGAQPISLEPPKVDTGEQLVTPTDPNAPPPVPPPMTPQFYDADGNNSNPFVNPHS